MIDGRFTVLVGVMIGLSCAGLGFLFGTGSDISDIQGLYTTLMVVNVIILVPFCRDRAEKIAGKHISKEQGMVEAAGVLRDNVQQLQEEFWIKERANKAKSQFLNRMSHDLRTPMNAIMGYSMLLEQNSGNTQKVEYYARKINMSGHSLLEMINDVLDASSLESGQVKLINSEFSITEALEDVKAAVKPQMDNKNQQFGFYVTDSAGIDRVLADRHRLCQVLRNLLSNATKYTPEGGTIDMIVNLIGTKPGELQFLCQIKDTGCGMSSDFMDRMFQPFEREENRTSDNVQGTGLGLGIARSFTELMDGELQVESQLEKGTLVTVRLPLVSAEETALVLQNLHHNRNVMEGLSFLVAEDNESNAEILAEVLAGMGAECVIKGDGQAVVEAFEQSAPGDYDVILMDIQMPVMNGYQATAALRKCKHPQATDIPVIAMTADAFEEDVQHAFASGMNGHVAKPLNVQAFVNTIAELDLKNKNGTR
jgi:signal transduction histidine kinase/CheY-like chemotaxis protein